MTGFTTHCSKRFPERGLLQVLFAWTFALALCSQALSQDIVVRKADLESAEEGIVLNADFDLTLRPRQLDAIANGVPLYFVIEFELTRPRWYWFDERVLSRRVLLRLSYHPLSRQHRISTGVLQQNFDSISDALAVLRQTRNWLVIERGLVRPDARYQAAVRMYLETSLLPRAAQLSPLAAREWGLESAWRISSFRAPQQSPAPVEVRIPAPVPKQ